MRLSSRCSAALLAAATLTSASPAPTQRANAVVEARAPKITPSPVLYEATKTLERRQILSDIKSGVDNVLSELGSNLPSWVASGIPQFFQDFPTGDKVQSSLGLDDDQVRALPTQVLNIDPYANWTDQGWNVRFHGNVYKQPNTSTEKLNDLANIFLIDTDIESLPQDQQDQARNVTASIFVLQQGNVNVSDITLEPAPNAGSSGDNTGGGGSPAPGGSQRVTLPYPTTDQGDFDVFIPIQSNGLTAGNQTDTIQKLNTHVEGASIGNSTAYLVPPTGLTVISDIDDILRVTKIYEPKEGLLNSFARPFTAWENMPDIYRKWSDTVPNLHFHYLTTTPEQVTRTYMQFIYSTYPGGSFDTRPLNFSDISATLSIRAFLLNKVFETFRQRKFILIADTTNSDVMKDYPQLAKDFPDQVQCIFLRNTSATDSGNRFPYDTSGFEGIPQDKYMFFVNADDLYNLDIANGQCYNQSIAQNLTFGYQNLPGGIGNDAPVNGSANGTVKGAASSMMGARSNSVLVAMVGLGMLFALL
ncbi:hypothetical protein KVT40_003480 [Elsinoe batatas]|uniref:Phosphatidate phosphatase APP1 catalytic domain-containing protein n=1 Tax=Elsinoe batatas TaxID=2601811 RepID=A0A8K0L686_9PEZI|nr:hypothetical protein KVT40_003480 [Elsinoe batatas]